MTAGGVSQHLSALRDSGLVSARRHGRQVLYCRSEIADELYISLSTVKTHLASLMAKLGARNRVEIAMWAYETDRIKR